MALRLVHGLVVLCSSCMMFLLLAAADVEDCPTSYCGRLGATLYFPLTNTSNPACGGLYVKGCDENGPNATLPEIRLENDHNNKTTWLEIESIDSSSFLASTLTVRDNSLQNFLSYIFSGIGDCKMEDLRNVTLPSPSPIMSFQKEFDVRSYVYKCNHTAPNLSNVTVLPECDGFHLYYFGNLTLEDAPSSAISGCTIFEIPTQFPEYGEYKFNLTVTLSKKCQKCMYKGGAACRINDKGKFRCVPQPAASDHGHGFVKVITGATAASTAMVVMLLVLRRCLRRKVTSFASIIFWKGENPTHKKIEIFLKGYEFHLTKRYTYSEIREMTNSFKNKLGQGGFGNVFKGKLPDGRLVAVKLLKKLKGNGEEFINEVASISQTSHVNIVSLFGFCFQGSKRALVYEFMPNGSLEKFIYEDNAAMVDRQLDCKTLHDITIGTARGLEYLHRGCNTRILHFDIKPHNILLDVDFCPKISDFGLSKICPRKESIVSMLGARGTAGYIAPELIFRNLGGVSHKSDVYSFGMMMLEMVGGRKNINVQVECSSETYFPHWIYKCLEKNQELALSCAKNENDNEIIRKMILVSLWCIQTDPSARPTMSKVVDMLEGRLESLQIPPKPFLFSQKSSPVHYSTSNLSN